MTNRNRIGLTWISFFSYALTGALVIVTGMVMGNIAEYFQLPISQMSNTFTFLNAGILVAIFLNAWLMEIIPLKRQLIFGFVLMILAIAGLMTSHSLSVFSLCMFVLGVVSGITMSIGTFLITHLYEGRQRGSRLLFTDSFFSMAGTIFPIIAGVLLARHLPWYWLPSATFSASWALSPGYRNTPPKPWAWISSVPDNWWVISGPHIWWECGYSASFCASSTCNAF